MTIVVTGFDRFGDLALNPTEAIVESLSNDARPTYGDALRCTVLPTQYASAGKEIEDIVRDRRPSVILGLGVSSSRDVICPERFALNVDDSERADNAGFVRTGEEIEPGGPAAVATTADITAVLQRLVDGKVRAKISNHAGTYVCNHVYYRALRTLERERVRSSCLFVHVPMPTAPAADVPPEDQWSIQDMLQASRTILGELVRQNGT